MVPCIMSCKETTVVSITKPKLYLNSSSSSNNNNRICQTSKSI